MLSFFCFFQYFLEREEGIDEWRERNIDAREKHQLVASHRLPDQGSSRRVPWQGIKTTTFQLQDDSPTKWVTPDRASMLIFKWLASLPSMEGRQQSHYNGRWPKHNPHWPRCRGVPPDLCTQEFSASTPITPNSMAPHASNMMSLTITFYFPRKVVTGKVVSS